MAAVSAKLPSLNRKNRPEPTKNPERPLKILGAIRVFGVSGVYVRRTMGGPSDPRVK
jgi:hypothetical protein